MSDVSMLTFRDDFQTDEMQKCPKCLEDFTILRQLPCMHCFCEKCLQDYLSSEEKIIKTLERIECPICKQYVCIPQKGKSVNISARLFPVNVILQYIRSDGKVKAEQPCNACHAKGIPIQAHYICMDCKEEMCKKCSETHQHQQISMGHEIISMEQFASNSQNVMDIAKGLGCTNHDGIDNYSYCKDHITVYCNRCPNVSHETCKNISNLKNELPRLLLEINPDRVNEQMKKIEAHFQKVTESIASNISSLESQVNDVTIRIRQLRKQLNDALDDLEETVTMEANRICEEEKKQKQKDNHHCQSLISSIINSHKLLEAVNKYGTELQVFLLTEKITLQMTSCLKQIEEKYMKMETTTVKFEVNPKFNSLLSEGPNSLGKIISRTEFKCLPVPNTSQPSREYPIQWSANIEIKGNYDSLARVVCLDSGHLMLAGQNSNKLYRLDYSHNTVTKYKLQDVTRNVCCVNDHDEVAVTLPRLKKVQFLSVKTGKIIPTREINTRYRCDSVADAGQGRIVISGYTEDVDKYYWSLINCKEKKTLCHKFQCQCEPSLSHVTLDSSFTRVYITVHKAHSLYCFDVCGRLKFVYGRDHLKNPRGVATDRYNNVYVVGCVPNIIHQLTPDGDVLQIISEGVPERPHAICYSCNDDKILVSNETDIKKLYTYQLKVRSSSFIY